MNKMQTKWIKALIFSILTFALFSLYLYVRRGSYTLGTFNKALGSEAIILGGITLIMGPLASRFAFFKAQVPLRRQLGVLAFYFAAGHLIATLLQTTRFAFPTWYLKEWIPVILGLLGLLLWLFMNWLSNDKRIQKMGFPKWHALLKNSGKIAFLTVFIHIIILKQSGWIQWLTGQPLSGPKLTHPEFIPESFLVFLIMLGIIIYRVITDYILKGDTSHGSHK